MRTAKLTTQFRRGPKLKMRRALCALLMHIHGELHGQAVIASVCFFIAFSCVCVCFFFNSFHSPQRPSHAVSVRPRGDVMLRAGEDDTTSSLPPTDGVLFAGRFATYQNLHTGDELSNRFRDSSFL